MSLFCTPEPWESENLSSFHQFAENIYEVVFDAIRIEIRIEIHPNNVRFDDQDRPPTLVGAFELDRFVQAKDATHFKLF